jgi:hypothetical protein
LYKCMEKYWFGRIYLLGYNTVIFPGLSLKNLTVKYRTWIK